MSGRRSQSHGRAADAPRAAAEACTSPQVMDPARTRTSTAWRLRQAPSTDSRAGSLASAAPSTTMRPCRSSQRSASSSRPGAGRLPPEAPRSQAARA
eukprot:5838228-Lingulodinium_polyedra.AAC.1